jgi:hypothetical protein
VILAEAFGGVRSDTRKNGMPPMNDKEVLIEAEELRRQSSLLSTFEEIAQTFLSSVSGERGDGKVFTFLQDYLDGSVLINGAYCSRRAVLLAVHDMKDRQQAPPALQPKFAPSIRSEKLVRSFVCRSRKHYRLRRFEF